jgi:hypothetical protein
MNNDTLEDDKLVRNETITEKNTAAANAKKSHRRTFSRTYSGHFLQRDPATPPPTPTTERKSTVQEIKKYTLTFDNLKEIPDFPGKVDAHFNLLISLERKLKNIDNYIVINKENISTLYLTRHSHAIAELKYKAIQLAKQLVDDYLDPAYDFAQNKHLMTQENHGKNVANVAHLVIELTGMNTISLESLPKRNIIFKSFLSNQKSKPLIIHSLLYKELPKELSTYIDKEAYQDLMLQIIELNKDVKKAHDQNDATATNFEQELSNPNFTFAGYITHTELLERFIGYLNEKYHLSLPCRNEISKILFNMQEVLCNAMYKFSSNCSEQESKFIKLYGFTTKENAILYFKNNEALLNAFFISFEKIFLLSNEHSAEQVQSLFTVFFNETSPEEKQKHFLNAIRSWVQEIENYTKIAQQNKNALSQDIYVQDPINTISLTIK